MAWCTHWWAWLTQRLVLLLLQGGRAGQGLLELRKEQRGRSVREDHRDNKVGRMPEMGLVTPGSGRMMRGAGRGLLG